MYKTSNCLSQSILRCIPTFDLIQYNPTLPGKIQQTSFLGNTLVSFWLLPWQLAMGVTKKKNAKKKSKEFNALKTLKYHSKSLQISIQPLVSVQILK